MLAHISYRAGAFCAYLGNKHIKNWNYAAHWVDSALKTAYAILDSWKTSYKKGTRKRTCPVVKRPFARVKQTLMKLEGNKLRITIKPHEYLYIDLSKRYFRLCDIGEPIITLTHIHLPVEVRNYIDSSKPKIGWDLNKYSIDGFSPVLGWIRIALKTLFTLHIGYDNKKRRINKIASKKLHSGKELKRKYI